MEGWEEVLPGLPELLERAYIGMHSEEKIERMNTSISWGRDLNSW